MTKTFDCEVDCAHCANKIEEKINSLEEVENCSVNFLTGKCKISFKKDVDFENTMKTVSQIFYTTDADASINIY